MKAFERTQPRHRAQSFSASRSPAARLSPDEIDIHSILDDSGTHETPAAQGWLAKHPRFHVHYTPTFSSRLDLVER